MAKETEWQAKILRRLDDEGGWGKKWATPYTVGVADLVVVVPGLGLVLIEVKLEKEWHKNTNRSIDLREKQGYELRKVLDAGGRAAVLVVLETAGLGHAKLQLYPPPPYDSVLVAARKDFDDGTELDWRRGNETLAGWLCRRLAV